MSECAASFIAGAIFIPLFYMFAINTFYDHQKSRDFTPNILRRFFAAFLSNLVGIGTTAYLLGGEDPWTKMGFHERMLAPAVIPTVLTVIFYTGTLWTMILDGTLSNFGTNSWLTSLGNLRWIRQAVVAPISEEISFRACSATLVGQCFDTSTATFVAPITFSLMHLHHVYEDVKKQGSPLINALANRVFQLLYTYIFGLYATHIFYRTGSIIAPILCHSICNLLGLPSVEDVGFCGPRKTRIFLYILHIGGFLSFFLLLPYLLDAELYQKRFCWPILC